MKKIILMIMSLFMAFSCANAALSYGTWCPVDQNGASVPDINEAGVYSYRINASSTAVMITADTPSSYTNDSGAARPAVSQAALVYGVTFSSLTPSAAGNYLILRDSTTAGISMTQAIAPELVVNATSASASNILGGRPNSIIFNPPIRCKNGISACLLGGAENVAPAGSVVIYYRLIGLEHR